MPASSRVTWAALVALLAGCHLIRGEPEPKPVERQPPRASVVLRVTTGPDLNPNDRGEATPVTLRVYQLRDRTTFTETSFEDLWTRGVESLGASHVGEMMALPLTPRAPDTPPSAHEVRLDPQTRYLGLMGLFSAERQEGLEERKLVVSVDEAAMKFVALTGHRIRIEDPLR